MANSWEGRTVRGAIPGRVGGLSTSRAKVKAARENGKLGGRPKNATKLAKAEESAANARLVASTLAEELDTARAELQRLRGPMPTPAPAPPQGQPAKTSPAAPKDRFELIELD